MKVVGAYVQPDGGHRLDFKEVGRVAWAAFNAKKDSLNAPGQLLSKVRVLHFTVFASLAWTAAECQGIRTLRVHVMWQLGRWWPRGAEAWPNVDRCLSR